MTLNSRIKLDHIELLVEINSESSNSWRVVQFSAARLMEDTQISRTVSIVRYKYYSSESNVHREIVLMANVALSVASLMGSG